MRLIDKDERMEWAHKQGGEVAHYANVILHGANVVDAVPVVRCKDCKWLAVEYYENGVVAKYTCWPRGDVMVTPDFYCADGKRRDSEDG